MKNFWHQLIDYNRLYRLFTLIVSISWIGNLIGGVIIFFLFLVILDTKFRNYCLMLRRRYYQNKERQEKRRIKLYEREHRQEIIESDIFWNKIFFVITHLPVLLLYKAIPYLTRLPVLEDYWQGLLLHHRYRNLRNFIDSLENNNNKLIKVTSVDIDQYHYTLFIKMEKSFKSVKSKIDKFISEYFGSMPDGIIVKLKRSSGQILIPRELIKKE